MIEPGTIVGAKYRIKRMLGHGGMGAVYSATHVNLGTTVALKFLNETMVKNPTVVERFMREAWASAQLNSDHVCRVVDVEREAGVPYIVMELLEGTDLAKRVRSGGPMSVEIAASYVLQACVGVAEAHAARIIHRDLKPGNLFLAERPDGSPLVKVLDFGVAKAPATGGDFSLTQTSNVVGSPGYMSPEQLRSSKVVDVRSDVWALGVILFELVIGKQPFRAETITDLALAIAMDPTPRMPGINPSYVAIVNKCLEKDPARRFEDVAALSTALVPLGGSDAKRYAGAVARVLRPGVASTPSAPRLSNEVTSVQSPLGPAPTVYEDRDVLPTERVTPVASSPEPAVTTMRGASGMLERSPSPSRRAMWIPLAVATLLVGAGVTFVAMRDDRPATAPAPTPVPTPAIAKPDPPAPVPPPSPPPPAIAPDAAIADVVPPPDAAPAPVPTDVKPVKPVTVHKPPIHKPPPNSTQPPPHDLGESRISERISKTP